MKINLSNIIEKTLWALVIFLMMIPLIQERYSYWESSPELGGFISKAKDPYFGIKKYLRGDFQKEKADYLNQNFGFRNDLVRLKNQADYELFNKANARDVIIGKEDYLFEKNYLRAYTGLDFIGEKKIKEQVRKLSIVRDRLRSKNTEIVIILAPGKGTFFPEYIPDEYLERKEKKINSDFWKKSFDEKNIQYLDLNQWFLGMKNKSPYPLYPKGGIHWSEYGQYLAVDSIINYIENLKQIQLPKLVLDSVTYSLANNKGEEIDISAGMNLWTPLSNFPLGDPKIHYETDSLTQKPKAIIIADSYYWGLYRHKLSSHVFNPGEFWFYNQEIYPSVKGVAKKCKTVEIIPKAEQQDFIFILQTDATLTNLGFGFIERLYEAYEKKVPSKKENEIRSYIQKIKSSPEWLEKIEKKSKTFNLSVEEMIRKDAEYMYQQKLKKLNKKEYN